MKRMICLFIVAGLIAGGAIAADVPSVNAVGYQTIDIAPGFNMIGYNWNGIGGSNEVIVQDLLDVTELTKASSENAADNLILWDVSNQVYKILYLYDYSSEYWDGKWVYFDEGKGKLQVAQDKISAGQGLWLEKVGASPVTVQASGQVPNSGTNTHLFKGNNGFTMFTSAYSADLDLNAEDWSAGNKASSKDAADSLYLWDVSNQVYRVLYLYDYSSEYWDGKWVFFDEGKGKLQIADDVFHMGQGAWYKTAPGSADVSWEQKKPYVLE